MRDCARHGGKGQLPLAATHPAPASSAGCVPHCPSGSCCQGSWPLAACFMFENPEDTPANTLTLHLLFHHSFYPSCVGQSLALAGRGVSSVSSQAGRQDRPAGALSWETLAGWGKAPSGLRREGGSQNTFYPQALRGPASAWGVSGGMCPCRQGRPSPTLPISFPSGASSQSHQKRPQTPGVGGGWGRPRSGTESPGRVGDYVQGLIGPSQGPDFKAAASPASKSAG